MAAPGHLPSPWESYLQKAFYCPWNAHPNFSKSKLSARIMASKKSKRGSVSLRILAVCLHGLKNCENMGEFLAEFVAFSRVTLHRKGVRICDFMCLLSIFTRSVKIFEFLGSQICPGSPQTASEKLEFCKVQAKKIDFWRRTFLFRAKFCFRVSFLTLFLTKTTHPEVSTL